MKVSTNSSQISTDFLAKHDSLIIFMKKLCNLDCVLSNYNDHDSAVRRARRCWMFVKWVSCNDK